MLTTLAKHKAHDGYVGYYQHSADTTHCPMKFSVFVPPQAEQGPVPVLYFLAGLTCTHETFMIKSGAQRYAAQHGLLLVAPDTSPRGDDVPDDPAWDLGQGASFYLDAMQAPWDRHYHMYSYISRELPELIGAHFPVDTQRQGIFGHSMGGHGALTIALKNPQRYRSVSAFAPIAAPMQCPWGQKAFQHYLGDDKNSWAQYDATALLNSLGDISTHPAILIDQGLSDTFLQEQLHPHLLKQAALKSSYPLTLNRHKDYDHSYYFIATFMEAHILHHSKILNPQPI